MKTYLKEEYLDMLFSYFKDFENYKGMDVYIIDRELTDNDALIELRYKRLSQRPSLVRAAKESLEIPVKSFCKRISISYDALNSKDFDKELSIIYSNTKEEIDEQYKKWDTRIVDTKEFCRVQKLDK